MNYLKQQALDHLFLREGTTYTKIPLSEILYIQADGNYAYIQTDDKRFAIKRSLSTIADELEVGDFVRASRGLLINFSRVTQVSFATGTIEMEGQTLKMGKAYHSEIKDKMPRL